MCYISPEHVHLFGFQDIIDTKSIVPEYVQAVSSALWTYASLRKVDLSKLATPKFLR